MLRTWIALATCLLGAAGCFSSKDPQADSESHFLSACEDSCQDGLECICGVCTAVCDPASDCSEQHEEASCVALDAFAQPDRCDEAAPDVASVCELACSDDSDCSSLSEAHRCDPQGRCRQPMARASCDYNDTRYAHGTSFEAIDGCNACTCEDGSVTCTTRDCLSCSVDGVEYANGESFPDDCNSCTCVDGAISCTRIECAGTCEYDGEVYQEGDTFPDRDGCNTCSCVADGSTLCTEKACPPAGCFESFDSGPCDAAIPVYWFDPSTNTCEQRIYGGCDGNDNRYESLDECRVACDAEQGTQCLVEGERYDSGARVPDPFSCNTCLCQAGALTTCTEVGCEEACPPNRKSGSSCAQCGADDTCEVVETACLPVCGSDADCADSGYSFCVVDEGHCANLCG